MSITIRKAQPEDIPAMYKLICELAIFEKEPDAVEVTEEELYRYGFSEDAFYKCIVAEVAEKVVGIALFYFRFSTWKGKAVHLEDLIVTKSFRGKGIGRALYDEVLLYSQAEGVRRVQWEVLDWNQPAIDFYEKSGASILKDWYLAQMHTKELATYASTKKSRLDESL